MAEGVRDVGSYPRNINYNYQLGVTVKRLGFFIIAFVYCLCVAGIAEAQVHERYSQETDHVEVLQIKASVLSPIVRSNDIQHIFLTVRDQNLNPISGAASMLTVHFPHEDQSLLMPVTDINGVSKLELDIRDQPPGYSVILEFSVVYGQLQATSQDSFRVWW
jgi:hypothetical protein